MKGRTFADQNRMRIGGVTKMNVGGDTGGSKLAKFGAAIKASKAAKNAPLPSIPKKIAPVPPKRGSAMAPIAGKPKAIPGMKVGGATKKGRGYR